MTGISHGRWRTVSRRRKPKKEHNYAISLDRRLSPAEARCHKGPAAGLNWIRYQIGGKLFAAVCLDDQDQPYYITLKLDPAEGDFLRGQYEDILPGYYMNKTHWNSVALDGSVPEEEVRRMILHSFELTADRRKR